MKEDIEDMNQVIMSERSRDEVSYCSQYEEQQFWLFPGKYVALFRPPVLSTYHME